VIQASRISKPSKPAGVGKIVAGFCQDPETSCGSHATQGRGTGDQVFGAKDGGLALEAGIGIRPDKSGLQLWPEAPSRSGQPAIPAGAPPFCCRSLWA